MIIEIKLEFISGSYINSAIEKAVEVSRHYNTTVTFVFNDIKLKVLPKDTSFNIIKQWKRKLNTRRRER